MYLYRGSQPLLAALPWCCTHAIQGASFHPLPAALPLCCAWDVRMQQSSFSPVLTIAELAAENKPAVLAMLPVCSFWKPRDDRIHPALPAS